MGCLCRATLTIRPGNGLKLEGIDSHVFRPMMTAFVMPGDGEVDVTSLKCAMSPGSRHGKVPLMPMPRDDPAATTAAMSVMTCNAGVSP